MKKVLIANRGEIAVRVIRACKDYGVQSVAIYADPDIEAPFVGLADEAYGLGAGRLSETYLDIEKIVSLAKACGADAIHPGYGFLSERAEFARAVIAEGITWIGPSPEVIEALGNKVAARRIATEVGAPLVAGSDGPVSSGKEVIAFAKAHGLPVAIKAAHGGGGRGLKVAWRFDEIEELFNSAVREATAAFGRGECFVERFLDRPRHIEAQVIADNHGNVVVLGTRDCSMQRRNQKLVEEAPAPFISEAQRKMIHDAARSICAAAGYSGAGTVEFLLGVDGTISFLEVNTRLQVEHPVTEETTGIDLVVEQLRVADDLPLRISDTPKSKGHSIEFRINAEDPARGFLPTPGRIDAFVAPSGPGVRLDSGVEPNSTVPANYDSLIAKLIVTGETREQAIARARRALGEFRIDGVATVLPFHRAVIENDDFVGGSGFRIHTRWIETEFNLKLPEMQRPAPMQASDMIRVNVELGGKLMPMGLPRSLFKAKEAAEIQTAKVDKASDHPSPEAIEAPISGNLQSLKVTEGQIVTEGELVAVMEAMKMETHIVAPRPGRIHLLSEEGCFVAAGQAIVSIT